MVKKNLLYSTPSHNTTKAHEKTKLRLARKNRWQQHGPPLLCVSSILLYIRYVLYVLPIHSFRFIKHQRKSQPHKGNKFTNLTGTYKTFWGYKPVLVWLYYILVKLCRSSLSKKKKKNSQYRLPRTVFKEF